MIDSATQEASVAAIAASAALPPFARISAPAAAVAGLPAAIPGCIAARVLLGAQRPAGRRARHFAPKVSYADRRPRLGRPPSSLAARWDAGDCTREETHEPHQGREAGDHQGARPCGSGHRLAGGPD